MPADPTEIDIISRVEDLYEQLRMKGIDPNALSLTMLRRGALLSRRPDALRDPLGEQSSARTTPMLQVRAAYANQTQRHQQQEQQEQTGDVRFLSKEEKTFTWIERDAITEEEQMKLSGLPMSMWAILITCAVGAAVQ